MHDLKSGAPDKDFYPAFVSHYLRTCSMAHKVNQLSMTMGRNDRILLICQANHMKYGLGVRERLLAYSDQAETLKTKIFLLYMRQEKWNSWLNQPEFMNEVTQEEPYTDLDLIRYFGSNAVPADLLFFTAIPD
jgi:hypothetical protein